MKISIENKYFWGIFAVSLVTFFLSKGLSLFPGYAVDDWIIVGTSTDIPFILSNGRFTQAAVEIFLVHQGIDIVSTAWVFTIGYFVLGSWAITKTVLLIAKEQKPSRLVLFVSPLFIAHPYLTEYSSFRQSAVVLFLGFGLFGLAIHQIDNLYFSESASFRSLRIFALLTTLVLLTGLNQSLILLVAATVVSAFVGRNFPQKSNGLYSSWKITLLKPLMVVGLSALFSVLVSRTLQHFTDVVPAPRMSLINMNEVNIRASEILKMIQLISISPEPVLASFSKALLLALILFIIFLSFNKSVSSGVKIIVFGSALFLISISIISVSGVWWLVPRVLVALAFSGMLFVLVGTVIIPKKLTNMFIGTMLLVSFLMSLQSSQMLSDQLRLNRWDLQAAQSIVLQASLLGATNDTEIVLVSPPWSHDRGLSTIQGDLNISALSVNYAVSGLFKEATGNLYNVSVTDNSKHCLGSEKWPEAKSFTLVSNTLYVCFK